MKGKIEFLEFMETDINYKTSNHSQIRFSYLKVAAIQRSLDLYCCLFKSGHPEIFFLEND